MNDILLDLANPTFRGWSRLDDVLDKARDEIGRLRAALKSISAVQYGLDMSDPTQDWEAYWHEMTVAYRRTAMEALKNEH